MENHLKKSMEEHLIKIIEGLPKKPCGKFLLDFLNEAPEKFLEELSEDFLKVFWATFLS